MTGRLTDIGRDLQTRLKKLFDTTLEPDATPLEIRQAALDDVERHVQPLGRGRKVFPYTRLQVRLWQNLGDRVALESMFEDFESQLRERLIELRCEPPRSLDIDVTCLEEAPVHWAAGQLFAIDYARESEGPAAVAPAVSVTPPALRVVVLKGATTEPIYSFRDNTVSIGRSSDLTDELGRVRRNRVAFIDTVDGVTETVGRAHARLRYESGPREYRVFDEGSSNGTSIIRDGSTIAVHAHDPRGVRLCTGDEIQVGKAILRVEIGG